MTAPTTTTAPPPASRFSTITIVAIALVGILVLGGVGALIGKSAESDRKFPSAPLPSPNRGTNNLQTGSRSYRSATPRAQATGGGPTEDPGTDGSTSVTLGDKIATVSIPNGWDVGTCEGNTCVELRKDSLYAYARVYQPRTAVDPAAVATEMLEGNWVKQDEHYSDVVSGKLISEKLSERASVASIPYEGFKTDTGGVLGVGGQVFAVVRSDGWVLQIQVEASSDKSPDEAFKSFLDALKLPDGAAVVILGSLLYTFDKGS